jgi:hypothetical protein
MAGLLVGTWCVVFVMMMRAVLLKQILWPEKDEDKDEGGFQRELERRGSSRGRRRRFSTTAVV